MKFFVGVFFAFCILSVGAWIWATRVDDALDRAPTRSSLSRGVDAVGSLGSAATRSTTTSPLTVQPVGSDPPKGALQPEPRATPAAPPAQRVPQIRDAFADNPDVPLPAAPSDSRPATEPEKADLEKSMLVGQMRADPHAFAQANGLTTEQVQRLERAVDKVPPAP